ncbi:MAG: DUF6666 family protein, partial [Planctomycetota bacterium]
DSSARPAAGYRVMASVDPTRGGLQSLVAAGILFAACGIAPAAEPAAEAAAPAPVAPAAAPQTLPSSPATVSLPDDVPPAFAPRQREARSLPPRRQPARGGVAAQPAPSGISSAIGQIYDPENPDAVMGFTIMRTPRGPTSRPILAPEGQQAQAMRAAADRAALGDARLGGGLAPRYTAPRTAATGRPERLAMNVEGIPSVMTQAPPVGGLDDTSVPGRAPPGAGAGHRLPTPADAADAPAEPESIGPGIEMPEGYGPEGELSFGPDGSPEYGPEFGPEMGDPAYDGGLLMGEYPAQLHVESFYDDPYACEDEEGLFPMCEHHGRICTWLRRFGRPYYGWRWYRDFTASAGITAFTNATDLGINGNFGTNEYLNWAMPFWNAFGLGWQIGWRGTQTNFQPASIEIGNTTLGKNARDQQFITTGFFTRAFEGRGLQGGAVYDYLHDSWFDNTDVSQLRYELSYVWGYHELGFWGASNLGDQTSFFGRATRVGGVASTLDLYTGFYRLQFGDANEWKVWGGGTGEGEGIVGTLVRAPMHKSLALEGTFTYVIPGRNQVINLDGQGQASTFAPSAWNVAVNVVWYPAGRSRRGLSSPYRPLFEVADNGSMIRSIEPFLR